jgi:DNA-binding MarR family transcriptional regulator
MEDSVDRHVARWHGWDEISFDDEVEAAASRISMLAKYLKRAAKEAAAEVGLQWFEYETLHALMIRERPGMATPTQLAERLLVSPAGITGRLDGMEEAGLVRRVRGVTDRRRVDIEITDAGRSQWREVMRRRVESEETMMAALSATERHGLNRLLRKLLIPLERDLEHPAEWKRRRP